MVLYRLYLGDLYQEEYAQMAAALDAGAAAGWLQPVISEEFPLSSAAEAQREVIEHKQGSCGKIILSIRWTPDVVKTVKNMMARILNAQRLEMEKHTCASDGATCEAVKYASWNTSAITLMDTFHAFRVFPTIVALERNWTVPKSISILK